jgi:plastocyanin
MRSRLVAVVVPLAALVLFAQGTALAAATKGVTISNFMFSPTPVKVKLGGQVKWTNNGPSQHTTTSDGVVDGSGDKGVGLWASGPLNVSSTFSYTFTAAGSFPYHCSIHTFMHGTIRVPMTASPKSGGVSTTFALTWATVAPTGSRVYDVQEKAPGGSYATIENGVTSLSTSFHAASTGTYMFRARERDTSTGQSSDYSPALKVVVS